MITTPLILDFHKTNAKAVLAITGGGSDSFGWLMRNGGASNTILEASIPYSMESLISFLGSKPDKFCSMDTAINMATKSYLRAMQLTNAKAVRDCRSLIGIGASCSLYKKGERKDRQHQIFVAAQWATGGALYIAEPQENSRAIEEEIAGTVILRALLEAQGRTEIPHKNSSVTRYEINPCFVQLFHNESPIVVINKELDRWSTAAKIENACLLPGSFNPVHSGHVDMAIAAYKRFNKPIYFEIAIHNVDKPSINYLQIINRIKKFGDFKNEDWFGGIALTSQQKFINKSKIFPNCTFIVGFDTFERICDPTYLDPKSNDALATITQNGCDFALFHRTLNGITSTQEQAEKLIKENAELDVKIMPNIFKEISSRQIRQSLL